MKPEIPYKSGFLQDAFTGWRRLLCYMGRPSVVKKAQREYHKAVRRKVKFETKTTTDLPQK